MKTKYLIVPIIFVVLLNGCGSQKLATQEEMTYEYIVEYPGLTKEIIFNRTLKWITNSFRSAKHVIEYQNKETGSIVGNGIIFVKAEGALIGTDVEFTMNIDIKDFKVRYRFINLFVIVTPADHRPMPNTQSWHRPVRKRFDELINSIKVATPKNDDF